MKNRCSMLSRVGFYGAFEDRFIYDAFQEIIHELNIRPLIYFIQILEVQVR